MLRSEIDGRDIDGFRYGFADHRGRDSITYQTPFGNAGLLNTKLDIGPPSWLEPDHAGWIPMPIHQAYSLPTSLPVMNLAENMAEKIARLSRKTLARDVYDLAWIATNSPHSRFDRQLVRRLAILKTWVDQFGLNSPPATWAPVTGAVPFESILWTRRREAALFDDENIGLLVASPPELSALANTLVAHYRFLSEPDATERRLIDEEAGARALAIDLIRALPGARFATRPLY